MKEKFNAETLTLAFCVALLPPIWAVLAPYIHVSTGAVALICAGMYVASGNDRRNAIKLSTGFLLGDLWACAALFVMYLLQWNEDLELFLTLFVLGGLAVLLSALVPGFISCPAWLCGWAIGLTILSPAGWEGIGSVPFEIAAAMLAGVWYVGVFLDLVQKKLLKLPLFQKTA